MFFRSNAKLPTQIAILKTALHFYANPKYYEQKGWQGDPLPSDIDKDKGETARMALQLVEPNMGERKIS